MKKFNGGILGKITTKSISAGVSGIFDTYQQNILQKSSLWPPPKRHLSTTSSNTTFPENLLSTMTATFEGFAGGETIHYTIETVSGPTLTAADFNSGSLTGTFTLDNTGIGTFDEKPLGDSIAESNSCKFVYRLTNSSGILLGESGTFAMADAATPIGEDITSSFYEISNRFLDSQTYMGTSSDYNGPYDVGQVQTDFIGSGRVYIGVKVTASTTFYNDIPIAGVQIISGTTLVASWIFNTSSGGSGSGWQTYTSQISGTSTQGFPVTPSTASAYTYSNITTGTSISSFTWATSTGSSYTGAEDGIGNAYKLTADGGSGTLAPVGDAQISQTSSTYYAYRETSGSTQYSGTVMRSPSYTFSGGEYIRVIHALTGPTSPQMDPDDSLYVAVI